MASSSQARPDRWLHLALASGFNFSEPSQAMKPRLVRNFCPCFGSGAGRVEAELKHFCSFGPQYSCPGIYMLKRPGSSRAENSGGISNCRARPLHAPRHPQKIDNSALRRSFTFKSDDSALGESSPDHADPTQPWRDEFLLYLTVREAAPDGISFIVWWGVSQLQYSRGTPDALADEEDTAAEENSEDDEDSWDCVLDDSSDE
ncbi:hypothetical protein B0H17DRAFT_1149467 [Mycena rosella]|uniref:Uncharacterized protein n=1 Tax=Mycena rosella TaxID=1033263 RepID=A0AAD7C2R8_MYCRO|nr:hypothetical protein B0H17DRAFT_1149467 [Mycena rosella]